MKNKIIKMIVFASIFASINISAQQISVNMNVFKPLPEVSFAAFLTNPFLESTPRILQIAITPQGETVVVKGAILWRKLDESSFEELLNFTTKPFLSRNFYNDDFSSFDGIGIDESNTSDNLLEENLKKGKPTGTYRIIVEVYDENMVFQSSATEDIEFTNPSQTLSIIQPEVDDELDLAGIFFSWTSVPGVSEYVVRANVRSDKNQSLEEALQNGTPIVNDKSVGVELNVNLIEILDREIVEGQEIVVQIKGVIEGPGGQSFVYSEIVNFKIAKRGSDQTQDIKTKFNEALEEFARNLKDELNENSGQDERDFAERLQDLLDKIANGQISFDDLKITTEDGRVITYQEFQEILGYLKTNPELFTNFNFEEK